MKRTLSAISAALVALAAFSATRARGDVASTDVLNLRVDGVSIALRTPGGWSLSSYANLHQLINVPVELASADEAALQSATRIIITTERRTDHGEAVLRLQQIAAESATPSTFLSIGDWSALQRVAPAPRPQPSWGPVHPEDTCLQITTVIAADNLVMRLEACLSPGAAPSMIEQVKAVGSSVLFSTRGDLQQVAKEVADLRSGVPLEPTPSISLPKVQSPKIQTPSTGSAPSGTPKPQPLGGQQDGAILLGLGSEPEVVSSPNGLNIVVAAGFSFQTSTNGGQSFLPAAGIPNSTGGDPSLAFGQSGNFYVATIAGRSTAVSVSTDGGRTFTFRANAVTCPNPSPTPTCGANFPDQEHIAADRFNAAPGGDQVYSAWRPLNGNYGIVSSADSANNWGTMSFTAGDFPRIRVAQDGFVYVVYRSGATIMINKYSSAAAGLVVQPTFPKPVAAGIVDVVCPVPGLDRCNNGNSLSSHMVAIDDTNPNHIYVSYAVSTGAGNEDILIQDSIDAGVTWTRPAIRINQALPARRYMPWLSVFGGVAYVSWYDRRAATPCPVPPCAANNDLTDYYGASASLNLVGNLVAGPEFKINPAGSTDPQCAGGQTPGSGNSWPCGTRAMNDSESCSVQPELAGICCAVALVNNACPAGQGGSRCDFSAGGCPAGQTCLTASGCPKFGDYNGNAAAVGRFYTVWASGTPPPGITATPGIHLYFASTLVGNVPVITIPGDVFFADTCVGTTNFATLYVCNTGNSNLEVGPISSTNSQFAVVTPSSGYPVTISPDFCFPFRVRFTPTSAGDKETTFIIPSSDPISPTNFVRGFGKGVGPTITAFIADSGNFGDVCLGDFKDLNFTINNAGGCTLFVSNITSSSSQFLAPAVTNYPLVIQPGDSVAVPIRFQPTSLGPKTGTIMVTSNDPQAPTRFIPVSGNAPPGDIRVTGSTGFGDVCAGAQAEKTISICNVGKCDLMVSNVAFVAPCTNFVLINNPFPAVVSHDACVSVTIRFTPASCGSKSCTLRINSDDPDMPVINLPVTANTPCSSIDVPPDLGFPPEVIQSAGACSTALPFPISNLGNCNLVITDVSIGGLNAGDFSLSGLPSFPIILEPGHIVGEGDMNVVFAPTVVARARTATISVTYISDPNTGGTTTVTRALCGEGVYTGARVLVMQGGVPLAQVERIHLQRINANRNKPILDTQDVAQNLPLVTVVPTPPCGAFQYHREYGTVSNPIQLLPGSYQVTASAIINGKHKSLSVGFDVSTCDFNPTIVINF